MNNARSIKVIKPVQKFYDEEIDGIAKVA